MIAPSLPSLERARLYRAARRIIDTPSHRAHMALVAILSLEVALDVHDDEGGAA